MSLRVQQCVRFARYSRSLSIRILNVNSLLFVTAQIKYDFPSKHSEYRVQINAKRFGGCPHYYSSLLLGSAELQDIFSDLQATHMYS